MRMSRANTGVDHISAHARPGPVVSVSGAQRAVALIDTIESPRRIALRGIGRHDAVFFDKLDSEVLAQCFSIRGAHFDSEAVESVLISVFEFATMRCCHLAGNVRSDGVEATLDRKSTRLNSSHTDIT